MVYVASGAEDTPKLAPKPPTLLKGIRRGSVHAVSKARPQESQAMKLPDIHRRSSNSRRGSTVSTSTVKSTGDDAFKHENKTPAIRLPDVHQRQQHHSPRPTAGRYYTAYEEHMPSSETMLSLVQIERSHHDKKRALDISNCENSCRGLGQETVTRRPSQQQVTGTMKNKLVSLAVFGKFGQHLAERRSALYGYAVDDELDDEREHEHVSQLEGLSDDELLQIIRESFSSNDNALQRLRTAELLEPSVQQKLTDFIAGIAGASELEDEVRSQAGITQDCDVGYLRIATKRSAVSKLPFNASDESNISGIDDAGDSFPSELLLHSIQSF